MRFVLYLESKGLNFMMYFALLKVLETSSFKPHIGMCFLGVFFLLLVIMGTFKAALEIMEL